MMKKAISLMLIISALMAFTACSGSDTSSDSTSETTSNPEVTATTEVTTAEKPKENYDGYTFRVMARNDTQMKWEAIDIVAPEANGEPINDAVYERNMKLEDDYNIKIEKMNANEPCIELKKYILADEDYTDLVTDGLVYLAGFVTEGYLVDYNEIPQVNFESPWWDKNIINELSVANKVHYMTGDISIMDNSGTWAVCFNKDMITEYGLNNPYVLVNDGKWTYDAMYEMIKKVPSDLDGNGSMDDFDQWGFVGEEYNTYALLVGSGSRIVTKDDKDLPILSFYNEHTTTAYDKVSSIQFDESSVLLRGRVKGTYTQVFDECLNKNFGENRALYWMGSMKVVELLRAYDVNFGILPAPKLDENQERYYSTFSTYNCTAYSVPITNPDLERTGKIFESMAEYSVNTLTPAYYDVTLKGKSLRDTESETTLDLVFASRLYDLGSIFDWGGIFSNIASISNADPGSFSSTYAKFETSAQQQIDKFIKSLK